KDGKIRLTSENRPAVIAAFLKGGHKWHRTVDIGTTITNFKTMWWKWWRGQQPESRFRNGQLVQSEAVLWDGLEEKCGPNGLVLVVGSLLWWREGIVAAAETCGDHKVDDIDIPVEHADWELAVVDVTWALDHMVRHCVKAKTIPNKRARRS
ncbi:hypothetical protein CPB85DRAFT_1447688, partial [Mucidula mucida]